MLSWCRSFSRRSWLDGLLLGLLVVLAFLLGCYEMGDSDIWWHLSGGRWILENRRVPDLDPFTFGSADRHWVDIHWGFEVLMAAAYSAGGVAALVLVAATAGALAVLAAVTARRPEWPIAVTVLCWLPALVLVSWRFDPRPEIFSLLYLSVFLAVLWHAQRRPALAWLLSIVQVLWVNTQGLFVLGPVVVCLFLAGRVVALLRDRWLGHFVWDAEQKRWWKHVGGASLLVAAAVLVNPYFLDGARFPIDLYPKVAQEDNPYKAYIDELNSPRLLVAKSNLKSLSHGYIQALYLLLLALPASFLLPAAWRLWQSTPTPRTKERKKGPAPSLAPHVGAWMAGAAALCGLLLLSTIALPRSGVPSVLAAVGDQGVLLLALATVGAAVVLGRRSWPAALVVLVAGGALAGWMAWLRGYFLPGPLDPGKPLADPSFVPVAAGGLVVAGLLIACGADPFRLLLAGAFGFLSLRAQQNDSRFALVAGLVMTWNLGEWAAELAAARASPASARPAYLRLALAGLLVLGMAAVVTDRYGRWTGEQRYFSLQEQPFQFAHDAVRFAGSAGLPEHALLYDLGQPCLYDFYHAPARKPFLDGRLEMPALETFQTYVRIDDDLNDQGSRWPADLDRLGRPLLLLTHPRSTNGEAALLTHPGWRCVYFDALASVFVARGAADETTYPTVDFAARHFRAASAPSIPNQPGAAFHELHSLTRLGAALRRHPEAAWTWRIPVLLRALDRGSLALRESPERHAAAWALLGDCHRSLIPVVGPAPTPALAWDPAIALPWAQATWCYRRAAELAPTDANPLRSLHDVFRVRRMGDAQLAAGERLAEESDRRPPLPWPAADQAAGLCMHLGRPAAARRIWQQARDCPSEALRKCRLASTFWVERDFETALRLLREARAADPRSAEACWALATLHAHLGDAGPALEACRQGLPLTLTDRQRSDLEGLQRLLHTCHREE